MAASIQRMIDVREVAPKERHPLIFAMFDSFKLGEAFRLVNDHDPKPLYYQLAATGFKKFLVRGNVVDLAVAVVVGAAFTSVVQAVVKGLITPLIGVFGGIPDFSAWVFTLNSSRFAIGEVINALLSFVVVAAVVYFFVVLPVTRLMNRFSPETPPALTRECPLCLSKIPQAARRCAFCTADLVDEMDTVDAAISRMTRPQQTR